MIHYRSLPLLVLDMHFSHPIGRAPSLALSVVFVISTFLAASLFTPIPASATWGASILDTATDLLEQGDFILRKQTDPLLESIRQHDAEKETSVHTLPEKFLMPVLTSYVGDNNQLMEYMTAAVVARATKRTLCLTPFFSGPTKHAGQLPRLQTAGLAMELRYEMHWLSNFVHVTPLQTCLQKCSKHLDRFWWLRHTSGSVARDWPWDSTDQIKMHDLAWSFVNWTSLADINKSFESFEQDQCVALGGLFPGLRWRGAYLAASVYIRPTHSISKAATAVQDMAIGRNRSFLAVHWRFEESNCRGYDMGLCFIRCGDGSVIDSGLHPSAREWAELGRHGCPRDRSHIRGVSVAKEDLIAAIRQKAQNENVDVVYLATDGWMRGSKELALVKEVVENLRRAGLPTVGLWKIDTLPNFSDGSYFDSSSLTPMVPHLSGHIISEIEQEICYRAQSFLGSGESTWSLSVFRSRLAGRRRQQIRRALEANGSMVDEKRENELVIEQLLSDQHAAGMQCRYHAYFNRAKVTSTAETYEDEKPDGWLDIEACEGRIGKGGRCKVAACF